MSELDIEIIQENQIVAILKLRGNINIRTSYNLDKTINNMIEKYHPRNFIFDMSGVGFASSIGIGVFVNLIKKQEIKGGDIFLVGMNGELLSSFVVLKLDRYFEKCDSVKDALIKINSKKTGGGL